MHKLKIIEVGEELGIVFPDEMIEAMGLKETSTIIAIPEAGGIRFVARLPDGETSAD
jgi:hypothetical protein